MLLVSVVVAIDLMIELADTRVKVYAPIVEVSNLSPDTYVLWALTPFSFSSVHRCGAL